MHSKIEHIIHQAVETYAKKWIFPLMVHFRYFYSRFITQQNTITRKSVPPETLYYYKVLNTIQIEGIDMKSKLLAVLLGGCCEQNIAARIRKMEANFMVFWEEFLKDPRSNPAGSTNYFIRFSARKGNAPLVRLLLTNHRINPGADDNHAIKWASGCGHAEIVSLLLQHPKVNPSAENNWAICIASHNGYEEVVRLLLTDPRVNPAAENHQSLRWSVEKGYKKIVGLLLDDYRIQSQSIRFLLYSATKFNHPDLIKFLCASPKYHVQEKEIIACLKTRRLKADTKVCLQEELVTRTWDKFRFFAQFAKTIPLPQELTHEIGTHFGRILCPTEINSTNFLLY